MNGNIKGDDGEYIKLYITDNNSTEHDITIEKETDEIVYHEQDGYPDNPDERTYREHELVNQTRRFTRFYVYRERGYETVEPMRNPDYIALAAMAVAHLSAEQFESYFGDYYQQTQSAAGKADPVVEVPELSLTSRLRVEQDIYVDLDDSDAEDLIETLTDADVFTKLQTAAEQVSGGNGLMEKFSSLVTADSDDLDEQAQTIANTAIDAVGPVRVRWTEGGTDHVRTADNKTSLPDREPEVRLQLLGQAYELDDIADLRQSLLRHLLCQVRDCYITMGISPPEYARVQGPGFYDAIGWYSNHDIYPNYHDINASISDWQIEQTPDDIRL